MLKVLGDGDEGPAKGSGATQCWNYQLKRSSEAVHLTPYLFSQGDSGAQGLSGPPGEDGERVSGVAKWDWA